MNQLEGKHICYKHIYIHQITNLPTKTAHVYQNLSITSQSKNMIERVHMVAFVSVLIIGIFVHSSQALIQHAVGRFPFLMPNVHPYRVSISSSSLLFWKIIHDFLNSNKHATIQNLTFRKLSYKASKDYVMDFIWNHKRYLKKKN